MNMLDIPYAIAFGLLLFLLILSAFFSGAETALTRARRIRIHSRARLGDRGAKAAETLLAKPEHMLSTILLGNNFVNIAASALATTLLVAVFGEPGIIYATFLMTVIVLIFSEILPKTVAVAHAESIACRVAGPLRVIQWLIYPVVTLLLALIGMFKHLLRIPEQSESPLTHQELVTMIDLSAQSGMLDRAREQMLISSLSLHQVAVKALMTPRKNICMLDGSLPVRQCLEEATRQPHSRYPVYLHETDHLVGIVHVRDMVRISNQDAPLVEAIQLQTPLYVPATKDAFAQLIEFQATHQHMAIVVDEFGDIEGLITLEDIIEDIVGEIHDESDRPGRPNMWPQADGSLVTAGTVSIHDINVEMDLDLPEEGATTIGGFIVQTLGMLPEGRMCIPLDDLKIEVLSIRGEWIQRVRIWQGNGKESSSS